MLGPGILSGLRDDTLEIYDLVVGLLTNEEEEADLRLEATRRYAAFMLFYKAAKRLAGTSLTQLKEEGLVTSIADGDHPCVPSWAYRLLKGII